MNTTTPVIVLLTLGALMSIIVVLTLFVGGKHLAKEEHGMVFKSIKSGFALIAFGVASELGIVVGSIGALLNWWHLPS